jgi:membrane protein required for colicin V production
MEAFGITFGDVAILIVLVVAALIGLAWGLVKAILFIATWVGAALITSSTYEDATPYFQELIQAPAYDIYVAPMAIFIVSLIVIFWVFSRIWQRVRMSEFSSLDRMLGLLGGLTVGLMLVCGAYLAANWELGKEELPSYIADARLRPYVQSGANVIRTFLPPEVQKKTKAVVRDTQSRIKDARRTGRAMQQLIERNGDKGVSNPDKQKGYAPPSRRDMQRLIESKQ